MPRVFFGKPPLRLSHFVYVFVHPSKFKDPGSKAGKTSCCGCDDAIASMGLVYFPT